MALIVVDHPLAQHLMATLRDRTTPAHLYRAACTELSRLLIFEATRGLPLTERRIHTPLEETTVRQLVAPPAVVPVLRAGLGMLGAALELFPDAPVGFVGLRRDEHNFTPARYYCKLPPLAGRDALCLDPMIATGGSAEEALKLIQAEGPRSLTMVAVVAAPEGIDRLAKAHPGVAVFCAALDRELNARRYILPGVGDFGDRLYGTEEA
ncbi:MAG: uracil phosphoribosyltransferase [Fimbriimonas ginsengisoli]|uniref:Uracil phosphoribosyltransferase n=1 Tax=Fimbriimonas ginsengisoli TaxID=1005039 RepID=A0A931LYK0_FIMGI|nr:uracil phosphoribosyltransferase [Fimbriimonas ginsengisoli]